MLYNMKKESNSILEQQSTSLNVPELKKLSHRCKSLFSNPLRKKYRKFVMRYNNNVRTKWKKERDENILSSLTALDVNQCEKDLYPNICNLLKVFVMLPVSEATAESSFSDLRPFKT